MVEDGGGGGELVAVKRLAGQGRGGLAGAYPNAERPSYEAGRPVTD